MNTRGAKNVIKLAGGMLATLIMIAGIKTDIHAAGSVSVMVDKSSAAIGETVTVTVQTSVPEDPATIPEVSVTYDADMLTFSACNVEYGGGGGGLLTFMGQSATISFTAAKTGNVNISAEAIIDDDGANPAVASAIVAVGASTQGDLSSDATLYVLEMNPGEMVPAFSSDVTDYKILIENDVTDITVSGAVSDAGAQITAASGFKDLKEGVNQAIITVTAADGTVLSYHFTIERKQSAESDEEVPEEETQQETVQTSDGLNVTIDDVAYIIQTTIGDENLPAGCMKTNSSFNGQPVEAALFEKGGMTLLYALTADGTAGEFFIYNESTGKLQLFIQLYSIENRFIVPIQAQETPPKMFKADQMQWNNSYIPAYVMEDRSIENADAFYLLYAVNNEGSKGFYLYDTMEGTYQRFLNYTDAEISPVLGENNSGKTSMIPMIVLVVLFIGSVIVIVNLIIKNKEMQEEAGVSQKPKKKKQQEIKKEETKKKEVKKAVAPQSEPAPKVKTEPKPAPVPKPAPASSVQPAPQPITPNVEVKVVPTPRPEVKRAAVPIYTLERQPVQLTREAPLDQLDDDFEFEFINIDNE